MIDVARFVLEQLTPQQWLDQDANETASWQGGAWIAIDRRRYSDGELWDLVQRYPLLLAEDGVESG